MREREIAATYLDASNNRQSSEPMRDVMGMMGNVYHKLKFEIVQAKNSGEDVLRCRHSIEPGSEPLTRRLGEA
ncbi:hypothetical protein E5D57_009100 [Metarhizium anisopliae]|nr:hypothetical protein E5D57_009100 [Metarhizium anisopliae]